MRRLPTPAASVHTTLSTAALRSPSVGATVRTTLDPCDDMTIWTAQEFTAVANTPGSSQCAMGHADRAGAGASACIAGFGQPAIVPVGQASVNVVVTGTCGGRIRFLRYPSDQHGRLPYAHGRRHSRRYRQQRDLYDPTHVTLIVSTVGAALGAKNVTMTNPDGQAAAGTGIFTVSGVNAPPTLQDAKSRNAHGGDQHFRPAADAVKRLHQRTRCAAVRKMVDRNLLTSNTRYAQGQCRGGPRARREIWCQSESEFWLHWFFRWPRSRLARRPGPGATTTLDNLAMASGNLRSFAYQQSDAHNDWRSTRSSPSLAATATASPSNRMER